VLNGLYITNWQLGKKDEARDAFGKLVTSGLELKRLPMKLLFQPGRSTFITSRRPAGRSTRSGSPRWPSRRAHAGLRARRRPHQPHRQRGRQRAAVAPTCRGGPEDAREGQPHPVIEAERRGGGLEEALVGLGTDDSRDALDRRVEFRVVDCV
jgi:hypothetical protein